MKNSVNLNSTDWCDIIFEGKNKSYGAFALRQSAWKRYILAFGIVFIGIVFVAFLPSILNSIEAATTSHTANVDEAYTMIQVDEKIEEPKEDIIESALPEPPKYKEMKKFVPPTITDDANASEEDMASMDDLVEEKGIDIGKFTVEEGSKDKDAIRKEIEQLITEEGKGKGQAKKEEIFINAEFMPQFPGGEKEMYKYIYDNLKYPVPDQEMGNQGKVILRFVVTKNGDISGIQVLKGVSPGCDREAIRVLQNMPRWIPGKQHGVPVPVYFTLPITYQLKSI